MKKLYYSLFAAAAMLLATSCSQEEDFGQPSNVGLTTFSVSLDGTAGSRTAGDGQTVNKLYYAVYDGETTQVLYPTSGNYGTAEKVNGGWTLELPLMKSETYDILFWAQKDGSNAYTFDKLTDINVEYDDVLSNKEDRDAFFNALDDFKASGSEHTVVLRRPFAQLNIATTIKDWEDAKAVTKTDKPVTASAVKVSSLATNFNVLTGAATATTPVTVEFKANELIDETISIKRAGEENPSEYKLLAMNYLLPVVTKAPNGVGNYQESTLDTDKDVVEVEFTLYKGENGAEQIINVKVPSTPVQRNYRTNIIGDLLTGEGFDIIIDEDFDGEENQEIEITADGIVKEDGIYHITMPIGLYEFAKLVNYGSESPLGRAATTGYSFKGETFVLDCDVDIEGEEWTPMDGFAGTFDGNGKTISNFKVNKAESAGLFGNLGKGATIKNLTVTDATILSNHWAGAIAGKGMCLKIENCKVENSTVTISAEKIGENWDNGDKAGAIIGYMSEPEAHITGCEANNVTIQAYRDLGGIVGYAHGTTISGNKVNDIVLTIDNTYNYKNYTTQDEHDAGDIVGEAASNSTVEDDNTATEGTVTIIYTAAAEYPGYYEDAEGNYCVTEEKGIETVLKNDDFWADKTQVSVILKSDLTVDVTAWDGDTNPQVFGNANTETITIDLQGKTLTFEQLNSDWNNIAANNAKLIIKNGHITSSGYNNGPWNRHDLNFACEVELIDITTDKAIALKNAGTLTNVSISDANTSDTYALWIQPNGQTVTLDGCTIDMIDCTDGRGIKIDEQYLDASEVKKVTLNVSNTTFKTEEKSAILVKSVAGADITLSNIDITNVQADNVCAVWVDEASAASFDLVNVTGGKKALEGAGYYVDENGVYYATSGTGINNAIANGAESVTVTAAIEATNIDADGKEVTIKGEGENASIDFTGATTKIDCKGTLRFEDLTIKMNGSNYANTGLNNNGGKHEYVNCNFYGTATVWGECSYTDCTFTATTDGQYAAFAQAFDNVTYERCTFTASNRAAKICPIKRNNEPSTSTLNVTYTDCTFNAEKEQNKAAVEIDNNGFIVNVAFSGETTLEGFIKDYFASEGQGTTNVTFNGDCFVANSVQFIAAVTNKDIEAIKLAPGTYDVSVYSVGKKNIESLDVNNKALVKGQFVAQGETSFKNVNFEVSDNTGKAINTSTYGTYTNKYKAIVNLSNSPVSFEGCSFVGNDTYTNAINYFQSDSSSDLLTIKDCSFTNAIIYTKLRADIQNCTFNNNFGAPYFICSYQTDGGEMTVKGVTVNNETLYVLCFLSNPNATNLYKDLSFDIQNNTNFKATYCYANKTGVKFATDGSITFAQESGGNCRGYKTESP